MPATPTASSLGNRWPRVFRPAGAAHYRASALFLRGRTEDAMAAYVTSLTVIRNMRAQNLLGAACATLNRRECAQAAFEASLRASPAHSTYVNLGQFSCSRRTRSGRPLFRRGVID
jgi:hypothetical protein